MKRIGKYSDRVRGLPCFNCWEPWPSQLHHHTGRRGLGQKSGSIDTMPLCLTCHHDFHAASGAFKTWGKEQRRRFQDEGVEWTKARIFGSAKSTDEGFRSLAGPPELHDDEF